MEKMDPPSRDEVLLAELAVLNVAVMKSLQVLALLTGEPEKFLSRTLENGLRDLDATNYLGVAPERRDAFVESARARYTDLITAIRVPGQAQI